MPEGTHEVFEDGQVVTLIDLGVDDLFKRVRVRIESNDDSLNAICVYRKDKKNGNDIYRGRVTEVFSGDDLITMIDLGAEDLVKRVRIRLEGVDTPNAVRSAPNTSAGKIRSYVSAATKNRDCSFEVFARPRHNTWVARVTIHRKEGDINLNQELINQGYKFVEQR